MGGMGDTYKLLHPVWVQPTFLVLLLTATHHLALVLVVRLLRVMESMCWKAVRLGVLRQ